MIEKLLFTATPMLDIFTYSFMIRAFIAGIVIALIGTFLVARRFSLIADTLGHISLAGIALGLLLGINPIVTALIASILTAILVDKIRHNKYISGESALAMLLSGGLALAIVLMGLARGFNVDLLSFLFGSISTVTETDLYLIVPLGVLAIFLVAFFYKKLLYIAFNEEGARVAGIKVNFLNILLMALTAVAVSLSIRIIGSLLIGALLVIPVTTASQLARSFRQCLILAIIISLVSVISGLLASFYLNLPAGGAIVLVSLTIFSIIYVLRR